MRRFARLTALLTIVVVFVGCASPSPTSNVRLAAKAAASAGLLAADADADDAETIRYVALLAADLSDEAGTAVELDDARLAVVNAISGSFFDEPQKRFIALSVVDEIAARIAEQIELDGLTLGDARPYVHAGATGARSAAELYLLSLQAGGE